MRISDWSSDVCSSDLTAAAALEQGIGQDERLTAASSYTLPQTETGLTNYGGQTCPDSSGGPVTMHQRSEERRVGNEWVSECRSRWSPSHSKKQTHRRPDSAYRPPPPANPTKQA